MELRVLHRQSDMRGEGLHRDLLVSPSSGGSLMSFVLIRRISLTLYFFSFNTGFPVLALLALRQRRSLATLGALAYVILISTLIIPTKHKWARK